MLHESRLRSVDLVDQLRVFFQQPRERLFPHPRGRLSRHRRVSDCASGGNTWCLSTHDDGLDGRVACCSILRCFTRKSGKRQESGRVLLPAIDAGQAAAGPAQAAD